MAKQRKRDGVYWRKDRRMYWTGTASASASLARRAGRRPSRSLLRLAPA